MATAVLSRWSRRSSALAAAGACTFLLVASGSGARPSLPAELPPAERVTLEAIVNQADVSTQVEAEPFIAKRKVFEYLLDHPEFASHVARALRLARYKITRTPEGLHLDDGWGATGHFWVVYAADGTRVMRARGEYRKTLLPTIYGEAITVIEYETTPALDGRSLFRTTVTGFVRLDSRLLAVLTKLASAAAQPKADLEARRLMKVFARTSRAIDSDPTGVLAQLRQRPDVPPRELEEFSRLLSAR